MNSTKRCGLALGAANHRQSLGLGLALGLLLAAPAFAADIPERPEKLTFPPLKYEPPKAAERV